MIVYIGNPIASTKKLLNLISEFGKIAGYKVDIQKLMEFLYTNNKILVKQTRGINLIYYSNKKNIVPRNKFSQGGKRPILRKL